MTAINRAAITGPITKPEMPNKNIPPRVENNTSRGCIWMSLPTNGGLIKLSIVLITKRPKIRIVIPCQIFPISNIMIPVGNQMIEQPTAGIILKATMINPQIRGPGTPTARNNNPPNVP